MHVERCYNGLGLHLDYWLLAVECSSKCIDLAMCVSGGFTKGLVPGAVVCIRLL